MISAGKLNDFFNCLYKNQIFIIYQLHGVKEECHLFYMFYLVRFLFISLIVLNYKDFPDKKNITFHCPLAPLNTISPGLVEPE